MKKIQSFLARFKLLSHVLGWIYTTSVQLSVVLRYINYVEQLLLENEINFR